MKSFLVGSLYILYLFHALASGSKVGKNCKKKNHCEIQGPYRLTDKIAIVGAGPAGIHMAYLLKRRGFHNIKIFEANCRLGGKSYTINYRNTAHDMGTVYLAPDYEKNVVKLAREFKVGKLVDLPPATVWIRGKPFNFTSYVMLETFKHLRTKNEKLVEKKIKHAMEKYIKLHQKLFGTYDSELMPRPSYKVLQSIKGTFKEFLKRHGVYILRPLFLASHTIQGYGQLDEIPAFYGLLWNTPKMLQGLLARMKGKSKTGLYMLENGFQPLWKKIVDDLDLKITYEAQVVKIKRKKCYWGNGITVYYRKRINPWQSTRDSEKFAFVVWTPELKTNLGVIDATCREEELFQTSRVMYFSASLVNSWNVPRGSSPVDYWVQSVESKKDHVVWAQRDSFAALHSPGLGKHGNGKMKAMRTTVVYQMGKYKPTVQQLTGIIKRHFKKMGGQVDVRETKIWRYFPRYSDRQIRSGVLWDILEYQGTQGMWYAGSSVCFESVKSVVEYNKLLVNKMRPPRGYHVSKGDVKEKA